MAETISYFNGSTSYAEFTDDIVLAGDFEIEIDVYAESFGNQGILGDGLTNGETYRLRIDGANVRMDIRNAANTGFSSAVVPLNGRRIVVKLIGNILSISNNGSAVLTDLSAVGILNNEVRLGVIGRRSSAFYHGNISSLKIWTDGDRTTGTQLVNMPMSEYRKDLDGRLVYHNYAQSDEWYLNLTQNSGIRINEKVFSDGFRFVVDFVHSDGASSENILLGYSLSQGYSIVYNASSNDITARIDGETWIVLASNIPAGRVLIDITVSELDVTTIVNGVQTVTNLIGGSLFKVDRLLFGYFSGKGFGGYVYSSFLENSEGVVVFSYEINDFSNVIANTANPLGANVWDNNSSVVTGSATQTNGQYSLPANSDSVYFTESGSTGLGYICTVDVVLGDINDLDAGLSSVQNTGWQPVRDSLNQPVPNRFYTLANNTTNDNLTLTKTGTDPLVINNVKFQRAIDYGVLNGTEGTNYEWKNAAPEAIGYNIDIVIDETTTFVHAGEVHANVVHANWVRAIVSTA